MSGLQLVKSDTVRVSVLPVAGCKFPAVFLGKVALDMVDLGVGLPCLRVDSEETLLNLTDERAQSGPGKKSLEYAIQVTASVWMTFEQVHNVVSGDVDFDSFGMAPWDAGGMHGDHCQLHEALQTMMLQWLMRLLCRPVIVHGLNRTMTMNTENGLDTIMMITTDSPRLTVTPGECYASDGTTQIRRDLRHTHDISAAVDCNAVEPNDLILRRLSLPPENVSAGCDGNHGSPMIDSAAVELNDLIFRRLSFPPEEFAGGWDTAAAACGAVKLDDMIFRRTSFPPDELPPGEMVTIYGLALMQNCHCQTTVVRITPDICYSRHTWCIEGYVIRSSIIVVLIIWYCFGVFRVRAMASDGLSDREQAGPSCAPSGPLPGTSLGPALDLRSESLHELVPDIPDVMGHRALRPDAAAVKVMSVRDSRCIRVVIPDDHVACGYTTRYCYMVWEKRSCRSCH